MNEITSNLITECENNLRDKQDDISETPSKEEVYKKLGSLYWKKYWALREVVKEVINKTSDDNLTFALQYLEWMQNDSTADEIKTEIIKEMKEGIQENVWISLGKPE